MSRLLFKRAKPGFRGVRGQIVTDIQDALGKAGHPLPIVDGIYGTTKPRFRKDLLDRKTSFANGVGTVHGDQYELDGWGLA